MSWPQELKFNVLDHLGTFIMNTALNHNFLFVNIYLQTENTELHFLPAAKEYILYADSVKVGTLVGYKPLHGATCMLKD